MFPSINANLRVLVCIDCQLYKTNKVLMSSSIDIRQWIVQGRHLLNLNHMTQFEPYDLYIDIDLYIDEYLQV